MLGGDFLFLGFQTGLALGHFKGGRDDFGFLLLLHQADAPQAIHLGLFAGFNFLLLQTQQILILGVRRAHHHAVLFHSALLDILACLNLGGL